MTIAVDWDITHQLKQTNERITCFVLRFSVPVNNFLVMSGIEPGLPRYSLRKLAHAIYRDFLKLKNENFQ